MSTSAAQLEKVALLLSEGKRTEARRLLSAWLQEHPNDAEVMIEYIWLSYDDVTMEQWKQWLESDVLKCSPSSQVQTRVANAYYVMGEDELAAQHFRMAIDLDETNWQAWHGLGLLHIVSHQEAEQFLRKAWELAPSEWQIAFNLGAIYVEQDKLVEAQRTYQTALKLAPWDKKDMIRQRLQAIHESLAI